MKKGLLIICALLISSNILASTQDLSSAIIKGIQTHSSSASIVTAFPMVYGGQDISRPMVASADESFLAGQSSLVG